MLYMNDFLVLITQVMSTVLGVYTVASQQEGPGLNPTEGLWSLLVLSPSVWVLRFHPQSSKCLPG